MDFIIDKDTQIYNINISNKYEYSYFDEYPNFKKWKNSTGVGIYITINKIVTTFIPCIDNTDTFESYLNGKNINYLSSEVKNNEFSVHGENGKFFWIVFGKRLNIEVEPLKENVKVADFFRIIQKIFLTFMF
jgi:hypothetical protein